MHANQTRLKAGFLWENDVSTIEESIKDAKIAQLLEDHLLLEKHIRDMPGKIKSSLDALEKAIQELPGNINDSIEALVVSLAVAEKTFSQIEEKHKCAIRDQLDDAKIDMQITLKRIISATLSEGLHDFSNVSISDSINTICVNGIVKHITDIDSKTLCFEWSKLMNERNTLYKINKQAKTGWRGFVLRLIGVSLPSVGVTHNEN